MKLIALAVWMALAFVAFGLATFNGVHLTNGTADVTVKYNAPDTTIPEEDRTGELFRRAHTVTCDYGYLTKVSEVKKAIKEIRKQKTQPFAYAHACSRMYFKKGTYANWCNDSDKKRSLPSHNNVADALQVILNECQRDGGWVSGVVNHPDLWRASVHNEWSTTNKLADLQ